MIAIVVKTRTAIVAATTAAAIVLFELLPFSNWEATMVVIILHKPYNNNNSYFVHQQPSEGDRKHVKHLTAIVISRSISSASVFPYASNRNLQTGFFTIMMNSASPSSSFSTSKNKLTHSSFRIEEDVIKSLERAAEKKGISLNGLVNRVLKNYVTSEMYFEELGFILVSKSFLRKTFNGLSGKQIEELGKEYGLTTAREYISYFYPQVNCTTLIQFLDIWFRRFQSCQHRVDDNNDRRHYYTVNHDVNMNFSFALQSILGGLIEPIIKSTVEFTNVTNTSIAFTFEV